MCLSCSECCLKNGVIESHEKLEAGVQGASSQLGIVLPHRVQSSYAHKFKGRSHKIFGYFFFGMHGYRSGPENKPHTLLVFKFFIWPFFVHVAFHTKAILEIPGIYNMKV